MTTNLSPTPTKTDEKSSRTEERKQAADDSLLIARCRKILWKIRNTQSVVVVQQASHQVTTASNNDRFSRLLLTRSARKFPW